VYARAHPSSPLPTPSSHCRLLSPALPTQQAQIEFENACIGAVNVTACSTEFDGVLSKGLSGAVQTFVSLLNTVLSARLDQLDVAPGLQPDAYQRARMADWGSASGLGKFVHHAMEITSNSRMAELDLARRTFADLASKATVRRNTLATSHTDTHSRTHSPNQVLRVCLCPVVGGCNRRYLCACWWRGPSSGTSPCCAAWTLP
jgi:hypothetical protein